MKFYARHKGDSGNLNDKKAVTKPSLPNDVPSEGVIRSLAIVNGKPLPMPRNNLFQLVGRGLAMLALAGCLAGAIPVSGATTGADAVVLVNSASAKFLDFQRLIQPYLDNFGVPYRMQDIATNAATTNLTNYALIIIGHKQLDTNHVYLDTSAQVNISRAVSNGVGLVNFDNDLSIGGVARYQFVQDIFGFTHGSAVTGANVTFPPTEPSSQMHYITALHPTNGAITLTVNMSLAGITTPTNVTVVLLSSGHPLLAARKYGTGRAVQWASYDWIPTAVLGPVAGLDDTVWRSMVWAARKPFVMRGMPNLVTFRVDDCEGPFWWAQMAIDAGFKPHLPIFLGNINQANTADLRRMVTNGNATTSIHSFTSSTMFYFNHATETSYSDSVMSNNFYLGTQWHLTNGIPISKVVQTHYSEIGPNAFAGLLQWGVEFIPIEVVPGTIEYGANPAPWLIAGPYRYFETPGQGQSTLPLYYADFLTIPGHPEMNGKFFNCYTEIRDVAPCAEWCPDNTVASSIARGTEMLKRGLDSLVLPHLFTHEWYIHPTSCCGATMISSNNWRTILSGITNNLAAYKPAYVTLDYGNQYVRATRTSRITSSQFDPSSGDVTVTLSGYADMDTSVKVFVGADSSISNYLGTVAAFTNPVTVTAATVSMPPLILVQPASRTNHAGTTAEFGVLASGTTLSFGWQKNSAAMNQATNPTLILPAVSPSDAASYSVTASNSFGAVTSTPAALTVAAPLVINSIRLSNGVASVNWNSIPGNNYSLQNKAALPQTNWSPGSILQATGNTATASESLIDSTQRFYRVFLLP